MLVNKDNNQVMSITFAGNIEILGKLVIEGDEQYILNSMTIASTSQGFALVNWPATGDNKKVWLNKSQIVATAPAMKDLSDKYIQATTGIIL
jgi:hypothetical protein